MYSLVTTVCVMCVCQFWGPWSRLASRTTAATSALASRSCLAWSGRRTTGTSCLSPHLEVCSPLSHLGSHRSLVMLKPANQDPLEHSTDAPLFQTQMVLKKIYSPFYRCLFNNVSFWGKVMVSLSCRVSVQGLHPLKDPTFAVFEGESFRDLVNRVHCW